MLIFFLTYDSELSWGGAIKLDSCIHPANFAGGQEQWHLWSINLVAVRVFSLC